MSLHCGSVCLLVLLGLVFVAGSSFQYVTEALKQTHDCIADKLRLTHSDIITNPLFNPVLRSINSSCQRGEELHLMNISLDIYLRIFSNILQQNHDQTRTPTLLDRLEDSDRSQVVLNLKQLQHKLERMKRNLSHLSHNREDVISNLNKIKVDEPDIQRKALAQFLEIYQAAAVIVSRRC